MGLSEESRQELKAKIIERLNERYDRAVQECKELQEKHVTQLQMEVEKQLGQVKNDSGDVTSLTIREILELERQG